MMIVTHEMAFARSICNRVFYMDEGGIYEDGTPEQIFDNPQRENTRRFVRRLKVLELNIESRGYDFIGMASEIKRYCDKTQISPKQANHIRIAFEELVQQLLMPALESPRIRVAIEYSEADEQATMTVHYNGKPYDALESGDELSRTMVKGSAKDISYEATGNDDFANCLTLVFGEKQ